MGQYIGEIRMFAGNFPPLGWELCQGQILPISGNDTLFTVLGTTYGGDGVNTFALPNLQSRIPLHQGTNPQSMNTYIVGQAAGVESVTLNTLQMPNHTHTMQASSDAGTLQTPAGNVSGSTSNKIYRGGSVSVSLHPNSIQAAGGSQPHDNVQPYLVVNFIIATTGIFPTRA
jgi:microcystin-dependent protein